MGVGTNMSTGLQLNTCAIMGNPETVNPKSVPINRLIYDDDGGIWQRLSQVHNWLLLYLLLTRAGYVSHDIASFRENICSRSSLF